MHGDIIEGSDAEIKHKSENAKIPLEVIEYNIKHPKYIMLDVETHTIKNILEDGSVLLHQVMHVEADIIKVSDKHIYEDSSIYTSSFTGYDCCTDFCKWLFDKHTKDCTIIPPNGAGYDN